MVHLASIEIIPAHLFRCKPKLLIRGTVYLIAEASPEADQAGAVTPLIDRPTSRDIIIAI
jgi:hypothetical protein